MLCKALKTLAAPLHYHLREDEDAAHLIDKYGLEMDFDSIPGSTPKWGVPWLWRPVGTLHIQVRIH
jgi:hypothetical protein